MSSSSRDRKKSKTTKFDSEISEMQKEMELFQYSTVGNGQAIRKTPRRFRREKTRKRKLLEQDDDAALEEEKEEEPRLRGATAALDEQLVIDSGALLTGGPSTADAADDDEDGEEEDDDDDDDDDEAYDDDEEEEVDDDDEEIEDEEYSDVDIKVAPSSSTKSARVGKPKSKNQSTSATATATTTTNRRTKSKSRGFVKRTGKKLYRMRNFKSHRLAQRHGEALGAHAHGDAQVALERLHQVAKEAPSAPQVYSSIGMVYQDMLLQKQRKKMGAEATQQQGEASDIEEALWDEASWKERLDLAQKAYGSYHAAAVLCKRDYSNWVQAADAARTVADIITSKMQQSRQLADDWRDKKLKWIQEAQKDYQTADALKPPGIDVPAKLAAAHIELGQLSEALTILTDLFQKNDRSNQTSKTYLLQAELMLRLGHEQRQFQKGIVPQNFMLRRWMRKYSNVFDWQERRLQAMILALEAAAGTEACHQLVLFAQHRVVVQQDNSEVNNEIVGNQDEQDEGTNNNTGKEPSVTNDGDNNDEQFLLAELNEKRSNLLAKHKSELEEFDRNIQEDPVLDSSGREKERAEMIRLHKQRLVDLVGSHVKVSTTTREESTGIIPLLDDVHYEMSASFSTVCSIASELIKHCLGMELYDAGRLVSEAVIVYMKERAVQQTQRREANEAFAERQQSTEPSILLNQESYDDVDDMSISDDNGAPAYLSDDDKFEAQPMLIDLFHKGSLPPEMQVLSALCLMGIGGMDFVASKGFQAVHHLEEETFEELEVIETEAIDRPSWFAFRRAMTNNLTKVSALAFIADVLKKLERDQQWVNYLLPVFRPVMLGWKESGVLDRILSLDEEAPVLDTTKRNQLINIVLSAKRLELQNASVSAKKNGLATSFEGMQSLLLCLLKNREGTNKHCIEALKLTDAFVAQLGIEGGHESSSGLLKSLQKIVEHMLDFQIEDGEVPLNIASLVKLPMTALWQTDNQKKLSITVHNLCVACAVGHFCGWEKDEYQISVIKGGGDFFLDTLPNNRLTALLSASIKEAVSNLWKILGQFYDQEFDIDTKLNDTETMLKERGIKNLPPTEKIASNGEDHALALLLKFARLCLSKATSGSESKDSLLSTAMSILLPVTQLGVFDDIWDSKLGRKATSCKAGRDAIRNLTRKVTSTLEGEAQKYTAPSRVRKLRPPPVLKPVPNPTDLWNVMEESPASRTVPVHAKALLCEWNLMALVDGSEAPQRDSIKNLQLQSDFDKAICDLRMCNTELAIQKACLTVTLCLLTMLECSPNPFVVMHHAAQYASQSPKAGNQDEHFKIELPVKVMDCTPLQALTILVRADCLAAIHFTQEATFLVSYVINICKSRRVQAQQWNSRWKVVGVCAFNIAIAIRSTIACTCATKEEQTRALREWETNVVSELLRCRSDALSMTSQTSSNQSIECAAPKNGEEELLLVDNSGVHLEDTLVLSENEDPHVTQDVEVFEV